MIENSIADFANRMNMPSFALNNNGMAMLEVGDLCHFYFEKTEDELLLYIAFPVESYDDTAAQRLLELSHYKHNYPINLFTGLYNNNAILLTRLALSDVTAASIETTFHFLLNLLPKAQGK